MDYPPFVAACVAELPPGWTVEPPDKPTSCGWKAYPPVRRNNSPLHVEIIDAPLPNVACCDTAVYHNRYISNGWIDRDKGRDSMLGYYVKRMCEMAMSRYNPLTGRDYGEMP